MRQADKMRAYRRKAKAAGKLGAFELARFVGVDGEGFSDGDEIRVTMGGPPHEYVARDHFYALLTDSDGHELYVPQGRLDMKSCLDFLLHIRERDANAVPVIFGGSYDICHMLAFDLDQDDILELLRPDPTGLRGENHLEVTLGEHDYKITYRPRKSLRIKRWPKGADKYERHVTNVDNPDKESKTVWRLTEHDSVTVWDVWGFFQASFVQAMDTWMPGDPDWQMIQQWKGNRKTFDRAEIEDIRRYNKAEVRCLAAMMDKVRDSIRACELSVTRWDGVGAVAGAMFKKHNVRDHMEETPQEVFDASRIAYSGGHIEATKVGYHADLIHHYDVNSAYPHQFRLLPSLSGGTWRKYTGRHLRPDGELFSLVNVVFHFLPGMPFYPLFWRGANGSIIYPERGMGWYWFPEFAAAREFAERFGAFEFRVLAYYTFKPVFNAKPFAWVEEYFERRKSLIEQTKRDGIPRGEEKTLKLGYNSCYGKTAQQLGARRVGGEIFAPPFFQLEWAGAVTAGCRAQLMMAAMQKPHAIISFATDGLYSTEPLDLDCPKEKILGKWDYATHQGMTMVMPGVYWLHDKDKVQHFSRGYDKSQMQDFALIHEAWRQGKSVLAFDQERMVTLGNATMSDGFWRLRGLFTRSQRELRIDGKNSKRLGIAMSAHRPDKNLCDTRPRDVDEDYAVRAERLQSHPFAIPFMDGLQEAVSDTGTEDGASFFVNSADAIDALRLA